MREESSSEGFDVDNWPYAVPAFLVSFQVLRQACYGNPLGFLVGNGDWGALGVRPGSGLGVMVAYQSDGIRVGNVCRYRTSSIVARFTIAP